jgi:hypothetical protein
MAQHQIAEAQRPLSVFIALILLWADLGLGIINVYGISVITTFWGASMDLIYIGFCVILMIAMRGVAQGANWARISYLPVFVFGAVRGAFSLEDILTRRPWDCPMEPTSETFEDGTVAITGCFHEPMFPYELMMASDIVIFVQALLLAGAVVLLFTSPGKFWFRSNCR